MSQGTESLPPRSGSRGSAKAKPPKKQKKQKKKRWGLRLFFGLVLILMASAATFIGYLALKANDAIETVGIGEDKATHVPIEQSVKQKPVAFVWLGLDARARGGSLNTDVIKVAAFDPNTKKAVVVSVPRDTYVDVEGYRARKANAFYADFYSVARQQGKDRDDAELAGKEAVREVFGKLFGIPVQYAASINFQGFSDVVDALGGVNVNVDIRMRYVDNADGTNIDLQPGEQLLMGKEALDFVRYRKSNGGGQESSDFERNRRQSEVLSAIVDKLKSFGGLLKAGAVIDAASSNISTDMPQSEIRRMLETYASVRSGDITFLSLDGVWRSPYVYADESSLAEARSALQAIMAE